VPAKEVRQSDDARGRLLEGVDILTKAVSITLGPKGRNVIIDKPYGAPRITKDGVAVAKEIELTDKYANIGARLVREVASRTETEAGDGTTTATILAQAIATEGAKGVTAGMNPMDIKRGIDFAVGVVVSSIGKQSKRVKTQSEIAQVATIAANNNPAVGEMISAAMEEVGEHGVITIEEASGIETELDVVQGMNFDRGFLSPYFVTNTEKMLVELEDPYILIHQEKLTNLQNIIPILELVSETGRSLLVIAEDIEGEALAALVVNRLRGNMKIAAVKAPAFGDRRKAILEDIAIMTGGELICEDLGNKLENATLATLGQAKRVTINKDETTIIDGKGKKKDIDARCKELRSFVETTESEFDQERAQERLAKLVGGVAVLRIGGVTETEVKERKDLVDDAMRATRAAVEEGVVPGGGLALLIASRTLSSLEGANDDQTFGINVVRHALTAPLRCIVDNAGAKGDLIVGKLLEEKGKNVGFDAQEMKFGDLLKAGIIDPAKVVRVALQNAASIAGLIVTTEAVIAEVPEEQDEDTDM